MSKRRAVLAIIKAIGGDPDFWGSAETCRDALEKAEAIITDERMEAAQVCHEWYAVRWARLRDLIHDNALHIEDEACCIMANGTADPNEPPTYDQILSQKNHEIARLQAMVNGLADRIAAAHEVIAKRAEKDDRHELVALISVLWMHAEPSIRHNDIREKVACVLSTAGNALGSEKPT